MGTRGSTAPLLNARLGAWTGAGLWTWFVVSASGRMGCQVLLRTLSKGIIASVAIVAGACVDGSLPSTSSSPSPSIRVLGGEGFDTYPPIPTPPASFQLVEIRRDASSICFRSDPQPRAERRMKNLMSFYRSRMPGFRWEDVASARDSWSRIFISPSDPCLIDGARPADPGYERAGSTASSLFRRHGAIASLYAPIIVWTSPRVADGPSRIFLLVRLDAEVL